MLDSNLGQEAVIKIVGVGGGGVNAVNRMIDHGLKGVEFIAINTDVQSLALSKAPIKLNVGGEITRGLGAGADPAMGKAAVEAHKEQISELLKNADMVFVAAGEGGGTGTGGAPVVAQIAKEHDALTVGIVTEPFGFEGKNRKNQADTGIEDLRQHVDALIVVPNNRLLRVCEKGVSVLEAFQVADQVLLAGVQGITNLITTPGLINVDFADVKSVISRSGTAFMGIGSGKGENRVKEAVEYAMSSPLLGSSFDGAKSVLFSIQGGPNLGLHELSEAADLVEMAAHPDANIIFGSVVDEDFGENVMVTLIAAGFNATTSMDELHKEFAKSEATANLENIAGFQPLTMHPRDNTVREQEPSSQIEVDLDEYDIPEFLKTPNSEKNARRKILNF